MISVVIPLYNKEKQIGKAIETVLGQSYQDFEVIVVNDGSTDNSANVVRSFEDPRIRLINQINGGVSAARNRGIKEAKGKFIAFLDADDEWKTEYLATQISLIKDFPECSVFVTGYEFHDQNNRVTYPIINGLKLHKAGLLDNYFEVASCSHPPLWTSAIIVLKEAIEAVGGFPSGVRLGEDLITWAKLACKFKIAYNPTPLAIYNFASQADRLVPKKQPNEIDIVGLEYSRLWNEYGLPYLNNIAALWHKMRMVTFVQLRRNEEARKEYTKIRSYIKPSKKDRLWFYLSFAPYCLVKFILKNKDKLR